MKSIPLREIPNYRSHDKNNDGELDFSEFQKLSDDLLVALLGESLPPQTQEQVDAFWSILPESRLADIFQKSSGKISPHYFRLFSGNRFVNKTFGIMKSLLRRRDFKAADAFLIGSVVLHHWARIFSGVAREFPDYAKDRSGIPCFEGGIFSPIDKNHDGNLDISEMQNLRPNAKSYRDILVGLVMATFSGDHRVAARYLGYQLPSWTRADWLETGESMLSSLSEGENLREFVRDWYAADREGLYFAMAEMLDRNLDRKESVRNILRQLTPHEWGEIRSLDRINGNLFHSLSHVTTVTMMALQGMRLQGELPLLVEFYSLVDPLARVQEGVVEEAAYRYQNKIRAVRVRKEKTLFSEIDFFNWGHRFGLASSGGFILLIAGGKTFAYGTIREEGEEDLYGDIDRFLQFHLATVSEPKTFPMSGSASYRSESQP